MNDNLDLRPFEVKSKLTGEIRSFTLTRAGMYNLAKFVENKQQTRYDILYKMFNEDRLFRNHPLQYFFKNFARNKTSNDMWWAFEDNYEHKTYVITSNDKCMRLEDTFCLPNNSRRFPKPWKKYVKRCENCGEMYFDQEITPDYILDNCGTQSIGYDDYCANCVENFYTSLRRCDCCGKWFDEDDMTWVESDECLVCDDCLNENYRKCEHCGEWFNPDNEGCYSERYGVWFCCDSCAHREGYVYNDDVEDWISEYDEENVLGGLVGDYHDNKGYLDFVDTKPDKRKKQDLYVGRETELAGCSISDFNAAYYERVINDYFDGNCVLERDGSVELETITKPMSEHDFFVYNWEKAFARLRNDGWRSHDTTCCGTHFHFSKGYLGFNDKERINNAKKVCRFFQLHWDDICKIARRQGNHYCHGWGDEPITKKTSFRSLSRDRYYAVNLDNLIDGIGTIEIRICKGTLKTETMLASADFFLHIVRNAKRISWKNIDNLNLWFKGIKNKNTITYIKNRHAFDGAF